MYTALYLITVCFFYAALAQNPVSNHATTDEVIMLSKERIEAESKLKKALSGTDESVFKQPLEELSSLEATGKKDIAEILTFDESEKREEALQASLRFWKTKMHEIISPYVRTPELYKNLNYTGNAPPEDPKFNNSEAYKKAEKEFEEKVASAVSHLRERYEKLIAESPTDLEDVTRTNWKKHAAYWAYTAAANDIRTQAQLSKLDAAKGDISKGENMLSMKITSSVAHFAANIRDIYSQ